ncbi:MAG: phosphatidate cytidylyltransferase [Betaproteobacteria bacterium]
MFAARFVTGIVLLALFCGALVLLPNGYWSTALVAVLCIAALEWAKLAGYRGGVRWVFMAIVFVIAVALLLRERRGEPELDLLFFWIATLFWVAVAPIWLGKRWRPRNPLVLGIVGCIVLVPTWLALARMQAAPAQLLLVLGVVWIADTAAYLIGRRMGRRALAPGISPGKTREGVLGAAAAVAVYYGLLWFIFGAGMSLQGAVAGVLMFAAVTALSVEGDLFESWMKRQAGIKDSGTMLPGHGGILDRIDGLTASLPVAALWLHYLGIPDVLA